MCVECCAFVGIFVTIELLLMNKTIKRCFRTPCRDPLKVCLSFKLNEFRLRVLHILFHN